MSLSCDCSFDYDGDGWYWDGHKLMTMPPMQRRKRCGCCNNLINIGEEVFRFNRYCSSRNYLEERIYGDEVNLAYWYTCEECSDLISAVEDLGFCWMWGESIKTQIADYRGDNPLTDRR